MQLQQKQKQNELKFGKGYDKRSFVCAWEDGRPIDPKWLSHQWRAIRKDENLSKIVRFHDLRHTHATILLKKGLSLKIVQERLGHESIATTGNIYGHVDQAMSQEANKILEKTLCLSKSKEPKLYRVKRLCQ